MTRAEMHSMLGNLLNDPSEGRYDSGVKDNALNHTVLSFVQLLPTSMLGELFKRVESKTTGAGIDDTDSTRTRLTKAATALFDPIAVKFVSGGYRKISTNVRYWFTPIATDNLWQLEYNLSADSVKSCRVEDSDLYFYLYPQRPTGYYIDINYLKAPATIASGTDCDLNVLLHSLIVIYTAFILRGKPEDASHALQAYIQEKGGGR